jgi:hypothetical protein
MTPELVAKAHCALIPTNQLKVLVANGGELYTQFYTPNFKYSMQEQELMFSFRIPPLTGYDIILGNDWIKHHSPIILDYKKALVTPKTHGGKKIKFHDESFLPRLKSLCQRTCKHCYNNLFVALSS